MSELSKAVSYSLLGAPDCLVLSKAVAYAILSSERNIVLSKAIIYAVLEEEIKEGKPFVILF